MVLRQQPRVVPILVIKTLQRERWSLALRKVRPNVCGFHFYSAHSSSVSDTSLQTPPPKRQKIEESEDDTEENFGPLLPSAQDILKLASSSSSYDPLLGDGMVSAPIPGSSIPAQGPLSGPEKDAWEKLRSDPNATLANLNPTEREEWMLKLPEANRKVLDYDQMQQSVSSFSRKGTIKQAVDQSWAESPADRARAASSSGAPKSSLELAKQMVAERLAKEKAEATAKIIEEHNVRPPSVCNSSDSHAFAVTGAAPSEISIGNCDRRESKGRKECKG